MGNRRIWALAVLAGLVGPSLAWGAAPASRPAGAEARWAGPKDEQWPQARKDLESHLSELAMAWLATDRMEAFELGNELVHAMRACTYMALLEDPGDKDGQELAKWLLEHEEVRRVLFRAIGEARSPGECLKQFRQLQGFEPAKVLEYPNLAAAFATAAPAKHYREQPEPATLLESFLYYADAKRQFCYNLKKMPYELSRYLADTRMAVGEREWAYKRYARAKDPGAAYFHVKYDMAYFKEHKDKKALQPSEPGQGGRGVHRPGVLRRAGLQGHGHPRDDRHRGGGQRHRPRVVHLLPDEPRRHGRLLDRRGGAIRFAALLHRPGDQSRHRRGNPR
jgi:hypothetical protein